MEDDNTTSTTTASSHHLSNLRKSFCCIKDVMTNDLLRSCECRSKFFKSVYSESCLSLASIAKWDSIAITRREHRVFFRRLPSRPCQQTRHRQTGPTSPMYHDLTNRQRCMKQPQVTFPHNGNSSYQPRNVRRQQTNEMMSRRHIRRRHISHPSRAITFSSLKIK